MARAPRLWSSAACRAPRTSKLLLAACLLAVLLGCRQAAAQTTPTLTFTTAQPNGSANTSTVVGTAQLTNAGAGVPNQPLAFGTVGTTGVQPLLGPLFYQQSGGADGGGSPNLLLLQPSLVISPARLTVAGDP